MLFDFTEATGKELRQATVAAGSAGRLALGHRGEEERDRAGVWQALVMATLINPHSNCQG